MPLNTKIWRLILTSIALAIFASFTCYVLAGFQGGIFGTAQLWFVFLMIINLYPVIKKQLVPNANIGVFVQEVWHNTWKWAGFLLARIVIGHMFSLPLIIGDFAWNIVYFTDDPQRYLSWPLDIGILGAIIFTIAFKTSNKVPIRISWGIFITLMIVGVLNGIALWYAPDTRTVVMKSIKGNIYNVLLNLNRVAQMDKEQSKALDYFAKAIEGSLTAEDLEDIKKTQTEIDKIAKPSIDNSILNFKGGLAGKKRKARKPTYPKYGGFILLAAAVLAVVLVLRWFNSYYPDLKRADDLIKTIIAVALILIVVLGAGIWAYLGVFPSWNMILTAAANTSPDDDTPTLDGIRAKKWGWYKKKLGGGSEVLPCEDGGEYRTEAGRIVEFSCRALAPMRFVKGGTQPAQWNVIDWKERPLPGTGTPVEPTHPVYVGGGEWKHIDPKTNNPAAPWLIGAQLRCDTRMAAQGSITCRYWLFSGGQDPTNVDDWGYIRIMEVK